MSVGNLQIGIKLALDNKEMSGRLEMSREQLRAFAADMRRAASEGASAFSATRTALNSISAQLKQARDALLGYITVMQAASAARGIVEAADAMRALSARLKVATSDASEFARAQAGVFEIANRYGASVDETARAFARLNPVIRQMGGGSAETLKMLDGLAASLKLSGATAAETSSVLQQFSQAMGSGKVNGDELRALMENAEPLMRAVAQQMGKTTGDLRAMAEQGQLTSATFGNALLPAIERLKEQAGNIPLGLSGSMQILRNEFSRAFGREFEGQATALSQAVQSIAAFADAAARAVRILTDAVIELGKAAAMVFTGAAIGGFVAAIGRAGAAVAALREAISAVNVVTSALVFGAAMKKLESLSRIGRGGVLGLVFFGSYELTDWLINLANLRARITDALTPVFQLFDRVFGIDREAEARKAAEAASAKSAEAKSALKRLADPSAFARLTQDLAYETRLRTKHKQELLDLEQAYQDKLATLKDEKARQAFTKEYQEARKELLLKQKQEMDGILSRKLGTVTQLPKLQEQFDAELAGIKASLKTAEDVIEASYKARLITEDAYWQAKAETRRRALDLEARDLREKLAAQQDLLAKLAAVKPKDANQQAELADRMREARNKIAELQTQLDALDGRRVVVDLEIQADRAKLDKELADVKAKLAQEFAQATGTETPQMRLSAIRREYDDLLARFGNDPRLVELVDKLVPVKAAQANLADLERQWNLALERMRNAEASANIQAQQGLITTSEAQAKIAEAHREAAAALEDLLPKMREAANVLGPEAQAKVEAFKVALMEVRSVADPVAASLNTSIKSAFEGMFTAIGTGAKTAKEAFLDFARSVIAAIQRIFAQKLAEQLFGAMGGAGGGIGGFLARIFKFASGGPVPGSGTGDTVPALLTPGEFVIRRDVARRIGYDLLAAINGGLLPRSAIAGRLAFASGGLVPAIQPAPAPAPSQSVRIINVVDPALAADYLNSPQGERMVLNLIARNARAVRHLLGA